MADKVRVAVDAMGGDNAPEQTVKGAVMALSKEPNLHILLTGREELIKEELKKNAYEGDDITIIDAPEVIGTGEPPVMAIRTKRESSLVKAMYMVKNGEADGVVSAGSTGAILVGGQVIVGRIKGVERAPLAPLIPTEKGSALLIDCGANVDARATQLVQFAKIGSVYMENVMGIRSPRVGLVNIGAEEEKGNALVKETYPLLLNCPDINFTGNIEAGGIPKGEADVIVCEAFVGNVILKTFEGVATTMLKIVKDSMMSSTRGKIGGALVKPVLKDALADYDVNRYGGAPMLGLNGLVVKAHGGSDANAFCNAILQCVSFAGMRVNDKIRSAVSSD